MKRVLCLVAAVAIGAFAFHALPALADDEPGLPDGGSLVSSTDGGRYALGYLGDRGCWSMAIRCEGDQATRYVTCATSSCVASDVNQLLDHDRTFDIPINCTSGLTRKQYIGLYTDDAGVPYCKVQKQP